MKKRKKKTRAQKEQATRDKTKTASTTPAATAAKVLDLFSPNSTHNSKIPPTYPKIPTGKSSASPRKLSEKERGLGPNHYKGG